MKIRTSELTGAALDWAVAKAIGEYKPMAVPHYSTDWALGGPIIEREKISLLALNKGWWRAEIYNDKPCPVYVRDLTPLIAAMRCYVASKLGYEVEIPKELI